MTHPNDTPKDIDRFWSKVDRSGGPDACWPWMGCRVRRYGRIHWAGQQRQAHRVAFFLTYGSWPEPCGLHRCDNPPCCNPAHIFGGTQAKNMADMVAKGRRAPQRGSDHWMHRFPDRPKGIQGEANGQAKLTEQQVLEIRKRHATGEVTQVALAREFGIDPSYMSALIRGRWWRHVAMPLVPDATA